MAAASSDGNQPQQQQQVKGGDDLPEDQLPPVAGASGQVQSTSERRGERTLNRRPARRRGRRRVVSVAQLSARALRLWRRKAHGLLKWFAARPLGQRALEAVGHTIATAEQATLVAADVTDHAADRRPLPFTWFLIMPVVMVLMVIRTGAALAERFLDVELPQNRQLVNWLERRRIYVDRVQAAASVNIRTVRVDENDPMHSFLNTWPFSILYNAAQQLGIIPVRVTKQHSDSSTESSSMPSLEPVTSSSSSGSSASTEAEEHAVPSSRELTPPPGTAADKSFNFSLDSERQTKEETEEQEQHDNKQEKVEGERTQEKTLILRPETDGDRNRYLRLKHRLSQHGERQKQEETEEEEQQDKQEEVEGKKVKEQKTEDPPTTTEEGCIGAAMAVVRPQPSAPPEHHTFEEAERAAINVQLPPPPQPTSQDLLAVERTSRYRPGPSNKAQKAPSKAGIFFTDLFESAFRIAPMAQYAPSARDRPKTLPSDKSRKF